GARGGPRPPRAQRPGAAPRGCPPTPSRQHRHVNHRARKPASSSTTVTVVPASFDRPELEVRSSSRRTKTGSAHWSGTKIVVSIPSRLRGRERDHFVEELVRRAMKERPQSGAHDAALEERARVLAELYTAGRLPSAVRFVSNQRPLWASCSPA